MSRRPIVSTALFVSILLGSMPSSADALEIFRGRRARHQPSSSATVVQYQYAQRWYPDYQTVASQENYGGGVPTYAYGYFGAKSHSSHGWHHGYYGDLFMWGPLRGR